MNIGLENANVTGKNKTGILVGYAKSPINDCYVKGNVSGHGNVGGLVGHLIGSTIKNCNATVTVTGSETVGGLVGRLMKEQLKAVQLPERSKTVVQDMLVV